ncbi:MAG: acetyl-CoA carboxylase carboxyltransferase subunit alpha [Gammaproteobacteria bacterium]
MAEKTLESSQVNLNFLDFEQPIAELEAKIEELRLVGHDSEINISEEIDRLRKRSEDLTRQIFNALTPWQIARLARHPRRPYTMDYVRALLADVHELHGDRSFADDPALVCGMGRLGGRGVVFIGHQKGRNTRDNLQRNFGMPRPEGYRKALRVMELAERFALPVVTFIDTPGAYPGIGAEERGQSEAIARNLMVMSGLRTPIVSLVIGEGGSGGALAIGVADRIFMLQYATYSVISPEGCASILWKSAERAADAAEAMGVTSKSLARLGLIDGIIDEPLGGAHRDSALTIARVGDTIAAALDELSGLEPGELVRARRARFAAIGEFVER